MTIDKQLLATLAPTKGLNASQPFLDVLTERRSIYGISKEAVIPDDRVVEIVNHAVKHTPSSFNGQTTRVVILFNDEHDKLWDMTREVLTTMIGAEKMENGGTNGKIDAFKAGHGTILFFEDDEVVRGQQEAYKLYAHNFPVWASQTNGMVQYICWTALEKEGYGASLQHYNEVIAQKVQTEFKVPVTWSLIAQMPFGKPTGAAGPKDFKRLEERVKVLGKH